ncbi:MAG TPA: NAD(P)/FAD-dependent oxidoreductase [Terriglobales bacterium]|nr:NAD(P)/FAD-dependent oxidoreductase [Terriglobales bacterium]
MAYDLIVVGGGVAGSSLARKMAAGGARVLLLEKETVFRDRVRGECLLPWGVADAEALGIGAPLRGISQEARWFAQCIDGTAAPQRDLIATTPLQRPMWCFYHPQAQGLLLAAAENAGVEVRRGANVMRIEPGPAPKVTFEAAGKSETAEARLVALCAGRNPGQRAELGFQVRRGTIPTLISGVWVSNVTADPSIGYVGYWLKSGSVVALFPQGAGRARAYFGFHPFHCVRLQGDGDKARFVEMFRRSAGDAIPFGDARPDGPLASFECADVWVEHPYQNGVALVGDAAASSDPSCGQGLSLAFRDARVLSEELLARSDWDAAGHEYAQRHDKHYTAVRTVVGWFYDLFQKLGPVADARRKRALPLIAEDPTRVPDVLFSGPEFPLNATSRARFFGEEHKAASG